tara:strand:+ start:54 stop:197 length:144 start_codon:yes stop_codon:yes gene_type:complete
MLEKLKVFLEKIEAAPWYVKIFIGSWVSLYTSLFIMVCINKLESCFI